MQSIWINIQNYLSMFSLPVIRPNDIVDIIIVSVIIYELIRYIHNTRAWSLFKGIMVLIVFTIIASVLQLHMIMWILSGILNIGITAAIIIFQPEIRKALESLGRRNIFSDLLNFTLEDNAKSEEQFDDRSIQAIAKACVDMGKVKTGALIVFEKNDKLDEIERTGIPVDAKISSQLLINIFEHNTPLHDGAVLVKNNRIAAATCYLPLSDNMQIEKELGTRHRAAIGVSEISDSITLIVSEETGDISLAKNGKIYRGLDQNQIKKHLQILKLQTEDNTKKFKLWKGKSKNEKNN
ncbi:MAG: diadenylate cyclase CdaA [Lachnospiraceae bacterium]|nr:diadenylate cyclase CdaA [Lachnospiraceae bacterium]